MTNVVCSVHISYKSGGRGSDVNVNPPDTQENYSENATFASCNGICDILHFQGPIHTRQRRRCGLDVIIFLALCEAVPEIAKLSDIDAKI